MIPERQSDKTVHGVTFGCGCTRQYSWKDICGFIARRVMPLDNIGKDRWETDQHCVKCRRSK